MDPNPNEELPESTWEGGFDEILEPMMDLELKAELNAKLDDPDAAATIARLQAELAVSEKGILLAQAELENFRRRMRRDMQDQLKYASLTLMTELLESVDNLNRAIDAHERDPNSDGLVQGVKMVAQQIAQSLTTQGCRKIDSVGQPFDPTLHQAVQMQTNEELAPNTVLFDLRPGFLLHDRVLRPSQVIVSTRPESNG